MKEAQEIYTNLSEDIRNFKHEFEKRENIRKQQISKLQINEKILHKQDDELCKLLNDSLNFKLKNIRQVPSETLILPSIIRY